MQKHAHLPRHLADNTRRNVKWTSEASAAKREKYSLEQLTVVSFNPHSPKLKQSLTEALVNTVVPSISLKLRMRSPHLQLLNRTTHPAIISSWASLLICNKLLKLSAFEPSYLLTYNKVLKRSAREPSHLLLNRSSTTENLPKLSAYNTWLSSSRASPLKSTEKLRPLSASDTNPRTNQNLKTSAHRLRATGRQKKIANDPSKKRRHRWPPKVQ